MSADGDLAEIVSAKLKVAGLIHPERLEEINSKIASGTASSGDWRLWIELGPSSRNEEQGDAAN